jgi:glucan phosphoethanolaminetransferase (alkaline phosphatase superfamily)
MFKLSKQHFYLILIIALIMLPNLLLIAIGEDSVVASKLKKIVFFVFSVALILIPLLFIKPKYYAWISIVLTPFILFELYNVYTFKAPSSEEAIASIFYTNLYEGKELLKGNLIFVFIFIFILATQISLSLKIKRDFILPKKQKLVLFALIFLIFSALLSRDYSIASHFKKGTSFNEKIDFATSLFRNKLKKVFPSDNFIKLKMVREGIKNIKNYNETIQGFKFDAQKKDSVNQNEIYVLVIGETARKSNFGLYDYSRNTTPNLSKQNHLNVFNNVYSSANLTSLSIAHLLTRATPNNDNIKFTEPAIINAYKEAGFKTYWLSNQAAGLDNVFAFYSSLADYYKNIAVSIDVAKYDEDLLPHFETILADSTSTKKFIIIHTLGSHFRYNFRYPDEFEQFKPTLSKSISISGNSTKLKTETVNSYDNSILYTDFILSKIISKLEKTNSVSYMYYISDHGENLYDDENKYLMHGFLNPTQYEIEIPLFVWHSEKYMNQYPSKITYLQQRKYSKISSENTFHTLLDLSNITYKDEFLKHSFVNKQFDSLQVRYLLTPDKKVIKLD